MSKAKKLAELASAAPLLVFAGTSVTTEKVQAASYRTHKCNGCSTEVAVGQIAGFDPFCPTCGGETAPGGDVAPPAVQEELLTSVSCPHCSTANVIEDRMMAAMAGKMHCVVCAKVMQFKTTAADDETFETEELEDEDVTDETDAEEASANTETAKPSDKVIKKETAGDGVDPDIVEDAEAIAKGVSQGAQAVADALTEHQEDVGGDMDISMDDVAPDDGDVEMKSDEDEESARLLAFVNGIHTMTLEKADAGENQDLMFTKTFHQGLLREVRKSGIKALASYGFKPVKVKVKVSKLIEKQVQQAMAAEKAQVTASSDSFKKDWDQCAKLAATALTKGFYQNRSNPLSDMLVASLIGMGFKSARPVVSRAMQQAAPEFIKATFELASELMTRSMESRNELAQTLMDMNPVTKDDESEEISSRLTAGVRPIDSKQEKPAAPVVASVSTQLGSELRTLKFS